jgi:hypothetical protein
MPPGYVMKPLILRPSPIGSLQGIFTVGCLEETTLDLGLGDFSSLLGVFVCEGADAV